jgi:hypothetical protein
VTKFGLNVVDLRMLTVFLRLDVPPTMRGGFGRVH